MKLWMPALLVFYMMFGDIILWAFPERPSWLVIARSFVSEVDCDVGKKFCPSVPFYIPRQNVHFCLGIIEQYILLFLIIIILECFSIFFSFSFFFFFLYNSD